MNNSFNGWFNVNQFNLEKVIDLVLTNGTSESIQSDSWLLELIGNESDHNFILDFGSGVGRNIFDFSIQRPNWNFIGYDNINMIKKSEEYSSIRYNKTKEDYINLDLISDWQIIKNRKFDCVYATIVFQHIYEKDLNQYILDIKNITKRLIVSGRRFNDDLTGGTYKNTWKILENNGLYPSNAAKINYSCDGDPNEHITCIYDF